MHATPEVGIDPDSDSNPDSRAHDEEERGGGRVYPRAARRSAGVGVGIGIEVDDMTPGDFHPGCGRGYPHAMVAIAFRRRCVMRGAARGLVAAIVLQWCVLQPQSSHAMPQGSLLAREALARCMEAEGREGAEQEQLLREGLRLAEHAVAADDDDAAAHFAVFCNLGKLLRSSGVGLGTFTDVRRVRREIDRTLELAPLDPDVLAAKGGLLYNLPSFLGGDEAEATQLFIRAFIADPSNVTTRAYLEKALQ
jgi:hypothetical protein